MFMLVLFDIDATLISTCRAGMKAMGDAARELFGPAFSVESIRYAGRLDTLIIPDILRLGGRTPTPHACAAFRTRYAHFLHTRLIEAGSAAIALPGVLPLLGALGERRDVTLGVLTGNFSETGAAKLERCGVRLSHFHLSVWADDAVGVPPSRNELPGVAMGRYRELRGRSIDPRQVVVIGDTPYDVECAHAHGCRSLGVATGSFDVDALVSAGADHVVADLSDTHMVLRWLNLAAVA